MYTIVVHLYAKDDPQCISKLSNKLIEASQVYSKDKETVSWFVMQDHKDPRAFCIVERYEQESVSSMGDSYTVAQEHVLILLQSQKYHLEVSPV